MFQLITYILLTKTKILNVGSFIFIICTVFYNYFEIQEPQSYLCLDDLWLNTNVYNINIIIHMYKWM